MALLLIVLRGEQFNFDIVSKGKTYVEAGKRITARHIRELKKLNLKDSKYL